MSILYESTQAQVRMYSVPKPYYKDPHLYVVGKWVDFGADVGDATGGSAQIRLHPLPSSPELPYLPKLQAWWTLETFAAYNNSSGMEMALKFNSSWQRGGGLHHMSTEKAAVGNADGWYHWSDHSQYRDWIGFYDSKEAVGYKGMIVYWISNDNTKSYYAFGSGLILKEYDQLVGEGLWSRKFAGR